MIKNSFEKGPEGWHSYDYHADVVAGIPGFYVLTTWEKEGGVDNTGYVWADQTRWSTDVPEMPISILALISYRRWTGQEPIDLREAKVSVYLRADDLHLYGAECYFWAAAPGVRWHYSGHPLEISDGSWAREPNRFTLKTDESLWHRSYPPDGPSLDVVLAETGNYGFSFVGFAREVHGRLSMDEFEVVG
jgi:hypothetical protein